MKFLFKTIGWLIKFTLAVLLLLVAASAIIIALEIKVELDPLRQPVAAAATQALDREVALNGPVSLVPTLWPTLEIEDVAVGNPEGWPQGELAKAGLLRLKLGIVPLLSGEIQVADITAEGVTLNLVSNKNGDPNWVFGEPVAEPEPEPEQAQQPEPTGGPAIRFESVDNLSLEDIELHYRDDNIGKGLHFRLASMQGHARQGEPFELRFEGALQDQPYRFDFEGGSLNDLRNRDINWPVKLTGMVVDTPVTFSGQLLREGDDRRVEVSSEVGKVDVGGMLAWLGVVDGVTASTRSLTAEVELRGKSLSELLEQSAFALTLKDGQLDLVSRDKKSSLPLAIETGTIKVAPGKPLTIAFDSRVDQAPVGIVITGSRLPDYVKQGVKLPLVVDLKAGGADIRLSSKVARPIDLENIALQLDMKGKSLAGFDPLLKTELPPLGPYSLTGGFALTPKGYEVNDLLLTIRDSRLAGDFALDAIARPYRLDVTLHSEQVQLNDFDTGDWSAKDSADEGAGAAKPDSEPEDTRTDAEITADRAKLRKLLSQETLSKVNARIEVKVDQVLSGPDKLGDGVLVLELDNAKLTLDPVKLGLPGGDATMSFLYHPQGRKGDVAVKALVEKFDYGVLARRIDPNTDVTGQLSLDVDLSAHVNDPDALLANAKGHLDFGLWPGDMDASLFDLWAVNVITSLMSEVDKEEKSRVNCIVVGFEADAGVMQQKVIFADTSEMRIAGKAKVDFRQKTIEIYAKPKSKKPQMFSLATPVGLSGTFDKFGIDLSPVALTATAVSFVTSPFHVPVRSLFSKDKEVDGNTACEIAWEAVRDGKLGNVPGAKPDAKSDDEPAAAAPATAPADQSGDEAVGIPDTMTY